MSNRIRHALALASIVGLTGLAVASQAAAASQEQGRAARAEHAVAGEVKKVDRAAKTLVIHTADGADETVKLTERTTVRGVKGVTSAVDAAAKASLEGGSVILHYTGEGVDRTAVAVDYLGTRTLKVAKGTVVRIDEAGTFVVVKTAAGTEETFHLTRELVIDTLRGLYDVAAATSGAIKEGTDVTVHYSEEGGKNMAYLVKHL